ncbi:unnamed protein product [Hymenolepis diminuta]|uniref:G_PROTEIN_RECEP_F1_2 domain-containing protein n=2 Tax=Hymenolepis diminuta TaxID=6216 RepID=A0A158QF57_HYMDI|nr:unnamed protein product [Hymenolepis diminuta]
MEGLKAITTTDAFINSTLIHLKTPAYEVPSNQPIYPINQILSSYVNTLKTNVYKRILLAIYCLIFILGSFLNLLLIYIIIRVRNPKSKSNRRMLLMHVCCDLALVWFGAPYTAYTSVYKDWKLGSEMCYIASFLIYFIVGLTNFLLVAICLNRSIAISRAGRCTGESDYDVNCRVTALITSAIVIAVIIALPSSIVSRVVRLKFHPLSDHYGTRVCQETWGRKRRMVYDFTLIIFIYLIPLFVICLSHHVVTRQLRRSHQMLIVMGHTIGAKWRRRRQRLIRLCVLMTSLFVLSWFPNHLLNILTKVCNFFGDTSEMLMDYSLCLGISNTVSEPLLLIFTCSAYQRFLRRLLARWKLVKTTTTTEASEPLASSSIGAPAVPQITRVTKDEPQLKLSMEKNV